MNTSEAQGDGAAGYDGSQLLDHRTLLKGDAPGQSPAEALDALNLDGLLDAAFGTAASDLKTCFLAALTHYGRAADVIGRALRAGSGSGSGSPSAPDPELMPTDALPTDPDSAVVVAVIDEGLPIARPDLATRLASHWEMAAPPRGAVPFGTEVTGTDLAKPVSSIASLRGAPGRYQDLGLNEITRETGRRMRGLRSHGASVMTLAADGLDTQHPLISVGFPAPVVKDTSGALLPFFILCGVAHIVARTRRLAAQIDAHADTCALALPVVINISYGVLSGPKDGSDPLSRAIDALCAPDRPALPGLGPVHVVWPMGNGRQVQSHARLVAGDPPGSEQVPASAENAASGPISLHLLPDDHTPSYVALRAEAPADGSFGLRAQLCLPGGITWTPTPTSPTPGTRALLKLGNGRVVHAYFQRETPQNAPARDMILLAFGPTASRDFKARLLPSGRWMLRAEAAGDVTVFVQRDDSLTGLRSGGRQARLGHHSYRRVDAAGREIARDADPVDSPIRRWNTVNAYATGSHIWRIGGFFGREAESVPYSGLGALGDPHPDGDSQVTSDRSYSVAGVPVRSVMGGAGLRESGTSVAAPQFARALAQFMAAHRAQSGSWPDRATLAKQLATIPSPPDPQTRN